MCIYTMLAKWKEQENVLLDRLIATDVFLYDIFNILLVLTFS